MSIEQFMSAHIWEIIKVISIIIAITASYVKLRDKVDALEEHRKANTAAIEQLDEALENHVKDKVSHLDPRLVEEIFKRFDRTDRNHDRLEGKIDTLIRKV